MGKAKGRGVQDFGDDGVNLAGRFAGVVNILYISLYMAALFMPEWGGNESNLYNVMNDAIPGTTWDQKELSSQAESIRFGLDWYCIDVKLETWEGGSYAVCHEYEDEVTMCPLLTTENGTAATRVCAPPQTGCDRFTDLCETRDIIKILLGVGITLGIIGAAFSEKIALLGSLMFIASVLGMASLGLWIEWMKDAGYHEDGTDVGVGGWLIIFGWISALAGAILCCLDMKCTDADDRKCCSDDGITMGGRAGSFTGVFTWVLFLLAVASPQWSETDHLSRAGGFCIEGTEQTPSCTDRSASFGIWYYCVEEQSAFFNGSTVDVCSEWGKDITVGTAAIGTDNSTNSTEAGQRKRRTIDNGSAKNGNERFDGVDAKEHREFVGFSALAGFILAALADVVSEKVQLAAVLMGLASFSGFFSMCAWVDFQFKLNDYDGADDVTYAAGGGFIIGSWMVAALSAMLYWKNHMDLVREKVKSQSKKKRISTGCSSV